MHDPISVLFVCLGNICRSPLAEALFRKAVTDARLEARFTIDSAGTSGYHQGEPPDERASAVAARRGVTVAGSSRQVVQEDLDTFDYIIVMDRENLDNVQGLVREQKGGARIHLLREFDPEADGQLEVPDPYFGGSSGFEHVHDLVERSAAGLLDHIRKEHDL